MESEAKPEDRTRAILLRLPQSEYDTIREAAKLLGKSMNGLLRQLAVTGSTSVLEAAIVTINDEVEVSST